MVLLMGMMFLSACSATNSPDTANMEMAQNSGFLGKYYQNLKPGTEKGDPKLMWIRPGVDFKKYKKVMIDYVIFSFANESDYKDIDANELKKLADQATNAFLQTVKTDFPVVSEPAPDVLRVRIAITDLKPSSPGLSTVTSVVPVGLAFSIAKKGATDSWTGSGATTAEMMVLDSMTNEVLGAAQDSASADFSDRFSKWGSAEEAFKYWAARFTKRLNTLLK